MTKSHRMQSNKIPVPYFRTPEGFTFYQIGEVWKDSLDAHKVKVTLTDTEAKELMTPQAHKKESEVIAKFQRSLASGIESRSLSGLANVRASGNILHDTAITAPPKALKRASTKDQRPDESHAQHVMRMQDRTFFYAIRKRVQRKKLESKTAVIAHTLYRESKGKLSVQEAIDKALADVAIRTADGIRLYLEAKFTPFMQSSRTQGKVKRNFTSLDSKESKNIRFYNLQRTFEPEKVSKSLPVATQLLSVNPYCDLKSRRTYNASVQAKLHTSSLSPFTKEEMFSPKRTGFVVSVPVKLRGELDHYRQVIQGEATPIAVELQESSRRAGYAYSAVLASASHAKLKTNGYWMTLPQLPTSVATSQVEVYAQNIRRADGLYSLYPRVSILK